MVTQGEEPHHAQPASSGLHLLIRRGSSQHASSGFFQTSSFLHFCKLFSEPEQVTQAASKSSKSWWRSDRWQMNNPSAWASALSLSPRAGFNPPAQIRWAYEQAGLHSSQNFWGPPMLVVIKPLLRHPLSSRDPGDGCSCN